MTLIISEPGPAAGEKCCLSYKISMMVTPVDASEKAIVIPTPLSDNDPLMVTVIPPSLDRHRDVQGTVLVGGLSPFSFGPATTFSTYGRRSAGSWRTILEDAQLCGVCFGDSI
jgi:hypothetical protein